MKKIIGVCLLLASTQIHSKSNTLLKSIPCTNEVLSTISSLGTPTKWSSPKENTVHSKMEEGGEVILKSKEKTSYLTIKKDQFYAETEFNSPSCKMTLKKTDFKNYGFTDSDLDKLLSKNKKGAILLWSPHMSLSVYQLVEMQDYFKKSSVPIKVLLDLNAEDNFSKKTLSQYDLPLDYLSKMNSRKLEKFGITVHYPSLVFYKDKKLVVRVPGHNTELKMNSLIKEYLD